jgi:hypothetical protein
VINVGGWKGDRDEGYFSHCFARLIDEFGVFVADEGVGARFDFILEMTELITNGFGVSAEGTWNVRGVLLML